MRLTRIRSPKKNNKKTQKTTTKNNPIEISLWSRHVDSRCVNQLVGDISENGVTSTADAASTDNRLDVSGDETTVRIIV